MPLCAPHRCWSVPSVHTAAPSLPRRAGAAHCTACSRSSFADAASPCKARAGGGGYSMVDRTCTMQGGSNQAQTALLPCVEGEAASPMPSHLSKVLSGSCRGCNASAAANTSRSCLSNRCAGTWKAGQLTLHTQQDRAGQAVLKRHAHAAETCPAQNVVSTQKALRCALCPAGPPSEGQPLATTDMMPALPDMLRKNVPPQRTDSIVRRPQV